VREPIPSDRPKRNATPAGQKLRHATVSSFRQPVAKDSLVSLVITRIRDALLRKELKAGDYLPSELELSRRLGVGKSSIREAVKMLEAMGVVEVRRGQGTLIRKHPGPGHIGPLVFQLITQNGYPEDLVELRMMFEPAFSVMAMERATDEDRQRMRAALERLESAVRNGSQVAEDDLAFHLAILHATRNPLVIRIGETIFQLFTPSIEVSMRTIAYRAVRDHRRIYAAFCSGNAERLRAAVLSSYAGWKKSLYRKVAGGGRERRHRRARGGAKEGPVAPAP
jgi:GntR family transcriptional repressor for pyruvate dehydrogenase complex